MGFRLRVLRAFVLLAGFFLMGFVLLAAMAVLDWLLVTRVFVDRAEWAAATLVTGTVVVAVAILQGMFAFLRAGRLETERHAVAVGPEDQPELWDLVRAAAGATGSGRPMSSTSMRTSTPVSPSRAACWACCPAGAACTSGCRCSPA